MNSTLDAPEGVGQIPQGLSEPNASGRSPDARSVAVAPLVSGYAIDVSRFVTIRVERVRQQGGPPLWAVRLDGDCLNKSGAWEWEPMPSGREDDFIARCRWPTAEEAIKAAIAKAGDSKEGAT